MDNPTRSWDEVREVLDKEIQVYYTKNEETNKKREEEKKRYIEWIIEEMKKGVDLNHNQKMMPDFSWTFGNEWPYIQKAMMMRYPNCMICGKPTQEIHHVRPRFLKGDNHPCNLVPLCLLCHDEVHRKIDRGITEVLADSIGQDVAERMRKKNSPIKHLEGLD